MMKFAKALGLKEDADEQTVLAGIEAIKAKGEALADQAVEAGKLKAEKVEELKTATARISELEAEAKAGGIDKLFADNVSRFAVTRDGAGELCASPLETSLRELALRDYDAAAKILASVPEPVATGTSVRELQTNKDAPAEVSGSLDPVLASQLSQLGISPEEYALHNPVNGTAIPRKN
jgi:hypothetical protein